MRKSTPHRLASAKRPTHRPHRMGRVTSPRQALQNTLADMLRRTTQRRRPCVEQRRMTGAPVLVDSKCLLAMTCSVTLRCPAWTRISRSATNRWHRTSISIPRPVRQVAIKIPRCRNGRLPRLFSLSEARIPSILNVQTSHHACQQHRRPSTSESLASRHLSMPCSQRRHSRRGVSILHLRGWRKHSTV